MKNKTTRDIESMSVTEIRNIEFNDCQLCNSQDECDLTTIKECRSILIRSVNNE